MLIDPTKLTTREAVKDEQFRIKAVLSSNRKRLTAAYNQRNGELRAWLAVLEGKPAAETEGGDNDTG